MIQIEGKQIKKDELMNLEGKGVIFYMDVARLNQNERREGNIIANKAQLAKPQIDENNLEPASHIAFKEVKSRKKVGSIGHFL